MTDKELLRKMRKMIVKACDDALQTPEDGFRYLFFDTMIHLEEVIFDYWTEHYGSLKRLDEEE